MSEYFTYQFSRANRRIHVHFVPPEQTEAVRVVERYVEFQKDHGSPDELIFLGFAFDADGIAALLVGDDLKARRPTLMPLRGGSLRGLLLEGDGRLVDTATGIAVTESERLMLMTEGLLAIFRKRSGMVETTPSFHYVKPSGQHVERFVRTSNTLVCGAEVNFMAAWLVSLLGPGVRVVHCDTSGIAALAHTVIALRGRFDGQPRVVAVDSFSSYQGLKHNSLRNAASSMALISASTSGNMARKIAADGVPHASVVTIFYLGQEKPGHPVLCDLSAGGFDPVVNHSEAGCPLCARGSIALRMEGDVFIPEAPKTTAHVVRAADAPPWLKDFINDALGCRAVRCAVARPTSSETDEVYIDAARLLNCASSFKGRWERLLVRSVPVKLARIVHFDDDDSAMLAQHARNFITAQGGKSPVLLRTSKTEPASLLQLGDDDGATLVIASSLVRGRKLTSVARALRETKGPVIYLIGVARMVTKAVLDETKDNLTYSSKGVRHICDWAAEIFLPLARPDSFVSWAKERSLLQEWSAIGKLDNGIDRRLQLLMNGREAADKAGYTDELFWPNAQGQALKLRDGFALFPKEYDAAKVTAADVYFAVSAVLHELRTGDARIAKLVQGPRHHALLSPRNFDRFNDGIIQAALLRAALPVEMDYSDSPDNSAFMLELLLSVFRNASEPQGEAALEFAMAILTGRMRLSGRDNASLVQVTAHESAKLAPALHALLLHLPPEQPG
jgi:hypothetical protein